MVDLKMSNGMKLYVKSMGKIFRVRYIARSDAEANNFTAKHPDTGVIAEDQRAGHIFIADLYANTVPSSVLPD